MQVNKYLQHIIQRETGDRNQASVQSNLAQIEARKRQALLVYLTLCAKRLGVPLRSTSRPTDSTVAGAS